MKTNVNPLDVRILAENLISSGDFYCAEAVLKAIKDSYQVEITDQIVAMATGLSGGIGGMNCLCGAISGGTMSLGLFFGRTIPKDKKMVKCMNLSRKLFKQFVKKHKKSCCKFLRKQIKEKDCCVIYVGDAAEITSKLINKYLS